VVVESVMNVTQGSHLQRCLAVAAEAALAAGAYFRSRLDTDKEVHTKSSPSDLVTDVDPKCEEMIRSAIRSAFPDHAWLGEESTGAGHEASSRAAAAGVTAPALWIVDPLDGTTNFVYGIPLSTVSIAYAENGVVKVGIVYDPYREESFVAVRGQGARIVPTAELRRWTDRPEGTLPGQPIRVSEVQRIGDSVVATGFPTRAEARQWTTQAGIQLAGRVKNLRALGSAALHLAYVACGRLDAFWEYDLNAWDLAAGALLVEEAGGCVRSLHGGGYHLELRDIVASGHPALCDAIAEAVVGP
jgi:myo-inositol-1(or 4)-monophosphatase